MELDTFSLGSPVHILALAICLAISIWIVWFNRSEGPEDNRTAMFRRGIIVLSLFSWTLTVLYGLQPSLFDWKHSLPLHFCNFANLISAVALAKRTRLAQSILYFWGIGLCSWALLTPSLTQGPTRLWFWIFWLYHLCIPISLAWVLIIDRFRPTFSDLRKTLLLTYAFTILLSLVNRLTGWDYGFVGKGMPEQPSPLDFLGPYPLRILWMLVIGTVLFSALYLPWIRIHRKHES